MKKIATLGFVLITFASQAIWVTFSPVVSKVASQLNVSSTYVGFLAVLYPVFFLLLTIPSGMLLDRNFKFWLLFGALTTALGGMGRLLIPFSYSWLFFCQLLAAIGQPFLLNGFVPFASRLFERSRSSIIVILSLSMYLGTIFASATGYVLYTNYGLFTLILPSSIISFLGILILALGMYRYREQKQVTSSNINLSLVVTKKDLLLLGCILGLGVAAFDNLATWLEPALETVNLANAAGNSVAIAIIAGLAGIAITPSFVNKRNIRTYYIRSIVPLIAIFFAILAFYQAELEVYVLLGIAGFLMLPAYPIIMDWIGKFYSKDIQGSATGYVGLVSRAISVSLMFITPSFIYSAHSYFLLLTAIVAMAFIFSLALPNDKK
ncbi:MAG TPA: MFS transporter [Geobacterales bacterium]|nr:MFS transporter [Geobacterales bacterium]